MNTQHSLLIDTVTDGPVATGGVLALGNFDGVHLGHREVIRAAHKEAQKLGVETHVLTFEPHPYSLFKKEGGPFLLTKPSVKHRLLLEAGADRVITLPFTPVFGAKTPEEFIHDVLIEGCAVRHVVVGFDFVFGQGRGGDRDALRLKLKPLNVGVTEVPPFRDAKGEVISSSRIRAALRQGKPGVAQTLLGRPFALQGVVQRGDQRGRTLEFPTANIDLENIVRPAYGAYAVKARHVGFGETFLGVANIGKRPTVGGTHELLECFLFDFDKEIYGEEWEVELHHFLRGEKTFPDLIALKYQIAQDVAAAKILLAA